MKVLVTGRDGQIVRSLMQKAAVRTDIELIAVGRPELDLEQPDTVRRAIASINPDLVISAAAYTAVDKAESESEIAYKINTIGAGAVAEAAAAFGAPIIHWSTDYVFAGDTMRPYSEADTPSPCNVYGQSKLDGERMVAGAHAQHIILRTSSVYSPYGSNFVKTMLRLAETRDQISVVSDQWVNPSSATDLAEATFKIIDVFLSNNYFSNYGLYHLVGSDKTNWSGFARKIFSESAKFGGPSPEVVDIVTSEYLTAARRPYNSTLNSEKFVSVFGWRMPAWELSLRSVISDLLKR
ncbi:MULTISPECIES: dTDP-4-dehydrorhamnose reductase [Brucella]|jgi:dTDP-4-dehydrorhamnose reductase|uniref:dTDP-4-dehydrorhamnose reductase n=1 Tax=Brucella TaxID=234 RepID=UPI000CFB2D35|nr:MULTISPECIES: dTDP-4-dehydrorhamnose reductase [Brucella]MQP41502.1 dTDP-4-dehydrorhamnose reductase [Ochrobactrum sp. MYb237]PQZ40060.1 dTDP-4-dehydrorhamnose reductase [Brucella pseudogrignonensis]PRA39781.1 dTDP-4-dehydrorhamnose reductase [Brucella pseudogrignonensis]PRA66214.1 dTDP-4-dehydrorhamnose reductase [Brucella pseudogrignonensis]